MDTIRLSTVIEKDGEIHMTGLPYRQGDEVDLILLARPRAAAERAP